MLAKVSVGKCPTWKSGRKKRDNDQDDRYKRGEGGLGFDVWPAQDEVLGQGGHDDGGKGPVCLGREG